MANKTKNKRILQVIPDLILVLNREGLYLEMHASDPSLLIMPKN